MSGIVGNNFDTESGLIKSGAGIAQVASDPSSPDNGEVWFNTTTSLLKVNDNGSTKTITTT